MNETLYMQLNI